MAVVLFVIAAWQGARSVIWQPWDPVYQFLSWLENNFFWIASIFMMLIYFCITYFFIRRPLRYLDEVTEASKKLASPDNDMIVLSDELKIVQDELNQFRHQAFRNAVLAKEAEQRKNDLIVYLAHDLKTPLTSVIGYLTLLSEEPQISTELRAKYTGIALAKAERLEDLINEFFDITRFNFTTLVLEQEPVHLSRMLEQISWEFLPMLSEKDLKWNLSIEPNVEMVCDPNKLARVFDNLTRNAVSYSYPHGEIFLTLKKSDGQVVVTFKNRGKQIPPEKLSHIFEQFYRVDASRASQTGGAGLGLAIAKEIVELHGGFIEAQSKGEWICFTVSFPENCHKIV